MNTLCKALLLTCAGTSLALAQGSVQGEKWKITSSMQMSGMSMPAMSSEICKQPGDDSVPVQTEKNCEVYDINRIGNVQSFKMRCTGKDKMDGSAQFTYLGADHYQGKMVINTQGETMTMNMEGRKIGGCDGGEINLKAREMQAQAQAQMAQGEKMMAETCRKFAAEGNNPYMMTTQCKDPADHKTFCAAAQTHDSFLNLSEMEKASNGSNAPGSRPLAETEQLCGFSATAKREQLCNTAEQSGKLKFLTSQCPTQAATLAAAQCAGRSYTSISDKYRDFCSSYASSQPESAGSKVKGIFGKGKKALGGLLGN
ncbi:DUF3617 domain-containing protein [Povalibacter sp.]|uniref:DUF3617 domain-containing protein n=1 Tax=Povalibacter sp. TaxID=1962978 RepID=UPI002F40068F